MAIEGSPKTQNMRYALDDAMETVENIDNVKDNLNSHVWTWGGNLEQAEYKLAVESVDKALELMKIVEDNVRKLVRQAHREDLARAKAKE